MLKPKYRVSFAKHIIKNIKLSFANPIIKIIKLNANLKHCSRIHKSFVQ